MFNQSVYDIELRIWRYIPGASLAYVKARGAQALPQGGVRRKSKAS